MDRCEEILAGVVIGGQVNNMSMYLGTRAQAESQGQKRRHFSQLSCLCVAPRTLLWVTRHDPQSRQLTEGGTGIVSNIWGRISRT